MREIRNNKNKKKYVYLYGGFSQMEIPLRRIHYKYNTTTIYSCFSHREKKISMNNSC